MAKITRTIAFLIIFYLLGYTHFLGGPFWLARFLFVITAIGVIILFILMWKLVSFTRKVKVSTDKETIKVDVKVIE